MFLFHQLVFPNLAARYFLASLSKTETDCKVGSQKPRRAACSECRLIYSGNYLEGTFFFSNSQSFIFTAKTHHLTGATGDRERCPYVLMANSQSDMEEWVRTLRRVIGVPTSGGSVKHYVEEPEAMYNNKGNSLEMV